MACRATPVKTSPLFLHSHSSGPKADSSPKGSRGLGGLKSEFLKQSTARGFRTQDQPAGSKGRKVAAKGAVCMWVCAMVIFMYLPMCVCL